jgi:DNA-binding transcriptional regulator YdaS (Cro superfamily)
VLVVNVLEAWVTSTAGAGGSKSLSDKLGLSPGLVVQELGWDEDVDDDVRMMIEDAIDGELIEEAMEAVDLVLLWWRDGDGDLVDGLVDALTDLTDAGYIWLMTPKVGRSGYVDAADLAEAAVTAGFALTNSVHVSPDWTATKLVRPKGARR